MQITYKVQQITEEKQNRYRIFSCHGVSFVKEGKNHLTRIETGNSTLSELNLNTAVHFSRNESWGFLFSVCVRKKYIDIMRKFTVCTVHLMEFM
jgi:hypothetical protein